MTNPEAVARINGLLRSGDLRSAHDELAALVAAHPDFVEGLRLLAGTKQALGDVPGAEELLRRALTIDANWTPTLATLGELLLAAGRNAEAEPLLQRAVTGQPASRRAALLLARYYNDAGQPARALALAAPIVAAGQADAELASQHIAALVTLGRQDEAVAIYRRIVAAAPNSLGAAHALAIALNSSGHYEEGARIGAQALARGHKTAAMFNTYAKSLIAQGALERAEAALRDSLRLEPRLMEAHTSLAQLVWLRTGDAAQATASLDQALASFSRDEALLAAKAAVLQGTGDPRAAHACLSAAMEGRQASPMLLVRAGLAALEFDPAAALALAERALAVMPANMAARTVLAAAQLGIGDARAALPHCQGLLATSPDDQYLIALQTTAWRLLGDARYAELCDYKNLVMPLQLQAPAPWSDMASFLTDLRASLNQLHDPNGHALLFQSLRRGTETTQDLNRTSDPVIRALFKSFAAPLQRYLEQIGTGADPLRRRNSRRWRFNGSWSVRLHRSGYHTNHVHPRGWISSACYIELPEGMSEASTPDGVLTFGEPGFATVPPLASEYSVRPQVGMLVLFPSYFWHGTVPFASDQPRLTVAFDAVPPA
jgi:tetratricopeptide (TPR) repeat protein